MINKNSVARVRIGFLPQPGNKEILDNNREISVYRVIMHLVVKAKRAALLYGSLLGLVFTQNIFAETGILDDGIQNEIAQITVQSDQSFVSTGTSDSIKAAVAGADIGTADPNAQARMDQQAMLHVAAIQGEYDFDGAVVANSDHAGVNIMERETGVPYAILLSMVALIAMVPVARRNGDF